MLRARDPYLAFASAVSLFAPVSRPAPGVHALAAIAADARLGADVSVGPFVAIGEGAHIGDRTVIYPERDDWCGRNASEAIARSIRTSPFASAAPSGDRVILQNGVVIGGDGYGFVRRGDGTHEKIPQVAVVVIEDDVELGANTTVDRPAVGETRIKAGTKIDNLVQIGHGVTVGRNVLMAAQVGIAGQHRRRRRCGVRRSGGRGRAPDDRTWSDCRRAIRCHQLARRRAHSSPAIPRSTAATGARPPSCSVAFPR